MQPHEMQRDQIEMWLALTAELAEKTSEKKEEDIELRDIVKVAQKVQDIINVLYGKSKIAGWRL
jgi:hypothetical protein